MEKRRETSRYAARDRRGKEADIFADLKEVVPIVGEGTVSHLDRIALLRVAATVCRFRKTSGKVIESDGTLGVDWAKVFNEEMITETLDGFFIIADSDATILYITESVSLYVGLTQTDMTGHSLRDFFHPTDFNELLDWSSKFDPARTSSDEGTSVTIRMKTVISPRGRNLNLKSALFKPVSFFVQSRKTDGGHVLLMRGSAIPAGQGSQSSAAAVISKFADTSMGTYVTRHSCDMRMLCVPDRLNYVLRGDTKSLQGNSFYDLVFPDDLENFAKSMKELFAKGHVRTPYYRLTTSNGSLVWVTTEASLTWQTSKGQKTQTVLCIHSMLGLQIESESTSMDVPQSAGVPVCGLSIKREVDDCRDYVGRQPEMLDCVDFTPLIEDSFATDLFDEIPDEPRPAAIEPGNRKSSFESVLQWLYQDKPGLSAPAYEQRQQQREVPHVPGPERTSEAEATDSEAGQPPVQSDFVASSGMGGDAVSGWAAPVMGRRVGSATYAAARPARDMAALLSPNGVYVPTCGVVNNRRGGPSTMFPALSPANSSLPSKHQQQAQHDSGSLYDTSPSMYHSNSSSMTSSPFDDMLPMHPIPCENIPFEEPDLSCLAGLAPFISEDDMQQIEVKQPGQPKDGYDELHRIFDNLPDWTPARPLVSAAKPVPYQQLGPDPILSQLICSPPPSKRFMVDGRRSPSPLSIMPMESMNTSVCDRFFGQMEMDSSQNIYAHHQQQYGIRMV